MRLLIITLLYSFTFIHAQIPKFDWIIPEGYKSNIGYFQLTTDVNSNTIVSIEYLLSPFEVCNESHNLNTEQTAVIFLIKYDPQGHCVWMHQLTDNVTGVIDAGLFLSTDLQGNILIAGAHRGKVWLDSENYIQSPDGVGEGFVSKLDPNGKLIWYRLIKNENGKFGNVSAIGVTCDFEGNTYLSTWHSNGHLFLDSILIEYRSNEGGFKTTLLKLNTEGNLLWYKKFEANSSIFQNIKVNSLQQVVVVGSFYGRELWVDQSVLLNRDTFQPDITHDAVLLVLNEDGNVEYLHSIGGLGTEYIYQLEIDKNNNIFLGGSTGSKEFEILSKKIFRLSSSRSGINFIAKIKPDYQLEWLYEDHVLDWYGMSYFILNNSQDLWTCWNLNKDSIYINNTPFVSPGSSSPDLIYIRFTNQGSIDKVFQLNGKGREGAIGIGHCGLHPDGGLVISGKFTSDTLYFGDYALPKVARKQIGDQYTSSAFIARISPDCMVESKDQRNHESNLIYIHPNPARDLLQIRFDEDLSADGRVEILTTTGTLMKSINIGKGSTSTSVDVRDWPAGVYFVRCRDTDGRSSVDRVVVE